MDKNGVSLSLGPPFLSERSQHFHGVPPWFREEQATKLERKSLVGAQIGVVSSCVELGCGFLMPAIFWDLPSGKHIRKAMENHHAIHG